MKEKKGARARRLRGKRATASKSKSNFFALTSSTISSTTTAVDRVRGAGRVSAYVPGTLTVSDMPTTGAGPAPMAAWPTPESVTETLYGPLGRNWPAPAPAASVPLGRPSTTAKRTVRSRPRTSRGAREAASAVMPW